MNYFYINWFICIFFLIKVLVDYLYHDYRIVIIEQDNRLFLIKLKETERQYLLKIKIIMENLKRIKNEI